MHTCSVGFLYSVAPLQIYVNESLRVSDIKRGGGGKPRGIFACPGEGHGQLRVMMITPPPTLCKACETRKGGTQILLLSIYYFFNQL